MATQPHFQQALTAGIRRALPALLPLLLAFVLWTAPNPWLGLLSALGLFIPNMLLSRYIIQRGVFPGYGPLRGALLIGGLWLVTASTQSAGTGWVVGILALLGPALVLPSVPALVVSAVGLAGTLLIMALSGVPTDMIALAGTVLAGVAAMTRVLSTVLQSAYSALLVEQRAATAEAEQASRAKGRFVAHISHEIRTPLSGILGAQRLLQGTLLSAEQRHLVDLSLDSGGMLLDLLNDVLDLSKIEAGMFSLEAGPVQLHDLLEHAAANIRPLTEAKGITLKLAVAPDVPAWVSADATRLRQIVGNLLNNAAKFTAQGRIDLVAERDEDGAIVLSVKDTGIGIPPEEQTRIFERFSQVDEPERRSVEGTGLGLALVMELVRLMDGTLGVESAAGAGSTFWMSLPLPACAPSPAQAQGRTASVAPMRLLLVEDNRVNQLVLRRLLEREGHTVWVASNGHEAVAQAPLLRPDVVLMDCHMPELDGFGATAQLRARGYDQPIVALTASAMATERERCLSAGMDGFLSKPLELAAVRSELARHQQRLSA